MGSQPTIEIVEFHLQEFCEAGLDLLSGQEARGSILADVLPSFARAMRACGRAGKPLAKELGGWKQQSQQLVRLASLHCANGSDSLIASLDQISREATRAIESLNSLSFHTDGDVVALTDGEESALADAGGLGHSEQVDFHLQQFCKAVLVLLHAGPENSSVLPKTVPSLYRVFSACGKVVLAQLRAELNVSRTTSEQLIQFADAHCSNAADQLEERVCQSLDSADRLISAMESLAWAASVVGKNPGRQISPLAETGAADEAQGSFTTPVTEADRAQSQKLYRLAIQSHQRQDFRTAETLYSEALKQDGTLRMAWLQRGRIRLLNANANLAIADLTRTLQLFAADHFALRWRGDALAICGRFDEALNDYDRSLEILPESSVVRYNRAVVLRMMGRLNDAWSEFEQLLQQRMNRPGAHLNRGLICLSRGQNELAIQEFQAALLAQPGLPEAIERLTQLGVSVDGTTTSKQRSNSPVKKDTLKIAQTQPVRPLGDPLPALRRTGPQAKRSGAIPVADKTVATDKCGSADQTSREAFDDLALAVLSDANSNQESEEPVKSSKTATLDEGSTAIAEPVVATTAPGVSSIPERVAGSAADMAAAMANRTPPRADSPLPVPTSIEVRCPGCHGVNTIRWEQLKPGKAMTCRRCSCHFAVQEDGTLVRMVRNRRGQWSEFRDHFAIWKDRRILATVASVLVLAAIVLFRPQIDDNRIPEDPGYPQELEPRAKLFTLAWLKGDFRTMRQLTDAVQSQELHLWAMDHPAPVVASPATLERDATFNVEIVDATHPNARVQVRIDGLRIERGHPVSELAQNWKQEGDRWIFQPVTRSNL